MELWVSAMDSLAGVIMLSGVVAPGQLEQWRQALELASRAPLVVFDCDPLKGLWFNRWLSLGVALDVAVLVAAAMNWRRLGRVS